jgi:hypothetical protein
MLGKWKASVDILMNTQLAFPAGANPLHLVVFEELITLNYEVETFLKHKSSNIQSVNAEHVQCSKVSNNNIIEVLVLDQLLIIYCFVNNLLFAIFLHPLAYILAFCDIYLLFVRSYYNQSFIEGHH